MNYGLLALRGSARVFIREKRPATFGELKEIIWWRFRLPKEDFRCQVADVSSPGVAPLTWVLGRPASPVPLGTRTRTELTPDTGLSHWWALPQVLPRTPRLDGDRLGFFQGHLGGLGVCVTLLRRSHLASASPTASPQNYQPVQLQLLKSEQLQLLKSGLPRSSPRST